MITLPPDFTAFRALSAALGSDPMRVQGPGGNTSIKDGDVMWIKASGTELAHAQTRDIFVAVDREAARAQAHGAGDGTCKDTVLDSANKLRPSIETTFHAALDWAVVAHTHSVATLVHCTSPEGCAAAADKLAGLPHVIVPYAKPGLPLTREILARATHDTRVVVLQNHGLICCGATVGATAALIEDVETRLAMPQITRAFATPDTAPPDGHDWAAEQALAQNPRLRALATAGSYWPDHVVFLGPALPTHPTNDAPVHLTTGTAIRTGATASQRAMLRCLSDVLSRLPEGWNPTPIGPKAEADILNWDAEKYRQALAARA